MGYQSSYTVSLAVSDGSKTGTDSYTFLVAGGINEPPVAVISGNQTVASGATGTLSGINSYDPESQPLTYFWTLPANVSATSLTERILTYTAPTVQINLPLTFELRVTDTGGLSSTVSYNVVVQPASTYPQWDANTVYNATDRVSWKGSNYEAKWWTQGTEPGTQDSAGGEPWFKLGGLPETNPPKCTDLKGGCCAPRGRNPGRNTR